MFLVAPTASVDTTVFSFGEKARRRWPTRRSKIFLTNPRRGQGIIFGRRHTFFPLDGGEKLPEERESTLAFSPLFSAHCTLRASISAFSSRDFAKQMLGHCVTPLRCASACLQLLFLTNASQRFLQTWLVNTTIFGNGGTHTFEIFIWSLLPLFIHYLVVEFSGP